MAADIEEVRASIAKLADIRPADTDLRLVSKYKIPGKVVMVLGGLTWRAEEMARNALVALENQDFVTAAILVRALMETTGCLVLLHNLLQKSIDRGIGNNFDKKINQLLLGSKQWEDFDDPVHVNDMLREVEKVIPGYFDRHYASMSEYAHPNWLGTFGAYGTTHHGEARVTYSSGGRAVDAQRRNLLGCLGATLGLFLGYLNEVNDSMGEFVAAVEAYFASKAD